MAVSELLLPTGRVNYHDYNLNDISGSPARWPPAGGVAQAAAVPLGPERARHAASGLIFNLLLAAI